MWFIFVWGYFVTNTKFVRFKILFFLNHLLTDYFFRGRNLKKPHLFVCFQTNVYTLGEFLHLRPSNPQLPPPTLKIQYCYSLNWTYSYIISNGAQAWHAGNSDISMKKSSIIQYQISLMYYHDYTIYYIQDLDVNPKVNQDLGCSYGQGYILRLLCDKNNQNLIMLIKKVNITGVIYSSVETSTSLSSSVNWGSGKSFASVRYALRSTE